MAPVLSIGASQEASYQHMQVVALRLWENECVFRGGHHSGGYRRGRDHPEGAQRPQTPVPRHRRVRHGSYACLNIDIAADAGPCFCDVTSTRDLPRLAPEERGFKLE